MFDLFVVVNERAEGIVRSIAYDAQNVGLTHMMIAVRSSGYNGSQLLWLSQQLDSGSINIIDNVDKIFNAVDRIGGGSGSAALL